jgi:hypothetical protein
MATVNKDFKIKSGLIVEGLQGTINGQKILTETGGDQYILNLIGGETLVKSVSNQFDVSAGGELSLDRVVVDAYYDAAGAAASAQAAAELTASGDATSKANAAQAAAEATASADATSKANAAQAAANTYTDGAVSSLVDSAPELLNTLNELAEALGDSPDTITNLVTLVGTKADTSYVDSEISDLDTSAQGYASAAQYAAENYADGLAVNYDAEGSALAAQQAAEADATSKANAAEAAAIAHADALTTSDIAEGTNEYFTDYRAKVSAVDLLTNASKSNIEITWTNQGGLVIAAENGVAGSTTTDLAEGTNLYFTAARAVTALENVTPNFTEVELNSVAKQVASTLAAPTAGVQTAYSWPKSAYKSAEFLVRVGAGVHTEMSKVLLTLDTADNIAITEYGIVGTNGSLATVSAALSGSNVQLLVTTINNSSTVTVVGTLVE